MKRMTVKTSKLIIIAVVLLFCAAIAKLSYIVLSDKVDGVNLKEKALSITTVTETLPSSRGDIYDANGEKLAETVNSYTLIAYLAESRTKDMKNPQHVVDKELTATKLAPILGMEKEDILKYLNQDKYQVQFGTKGNNLTENVKSKIEALDLPGLDFIVSHQRFYKKAGAASYILGYAKPNDEGVITGELGIEKYYDDELSGIDGYKKYQKYTSGNYQIPNTRVEEQKAINGSDIYLTIDSNIQLIVENAIKKLSDEASMEWMVFTVMDANTGAIVASATNPNFNPNDTNTITSFMNPLVSYQYEPGSVMKIFSFASAIEAGKYNGSETYKSGCIKVYEDTICDSNKTGWGTITFDQGFANSSNVAASILADRLKADSLRSYYQDLGFGKLTGIELSNEAKGVINFKYGSEPASAAFGQGITVTPIQILQAMTFLTNDGTVIKPYIVDKIVDSDGNTVFQGERTEVKKVYSSATATKLRSLMHDVIEFGTGKSYKTENVKLIAKTGTAQIASPNGGYLDGDYDTIKSIAGIFPEDNPKYIIYMANSKMVASVKTLASVVTTAIEEIASYAKLTDKKSDVDYSKIINLNNYISKNVADTVDSLNSQNLKPIIIGDGTYVINQYPLKNTSVIAGDKIFLMTNSNKYIMPDITNWSRNEVETYCNLINLNCSFKGYGYVLSQSIATGEEITNDKKLEIELTQIEL